MSCRVLIADDAEGIRVLFRSFLEEDSDITVVGEAVDGLETVAKVLALKPDVLLLDLSMPQMDGLEVLFHLRRRRVDTEVVVISGYGKDRMAAVAMAHGAALYVEKGASPEVLRRVVLDACRRLAG